MSFHLPHIAHTFALKRQTYERFFFLRRLRPSHSLRISSLHLKDIRGVQGTARHRTDHHQRADAVRALGRRQHNAIQHHQLPYWHGEQRQGVFSMFYVLPNAMHAFLPICTNSLNSLISAMIICLLILFYFLSPHQTF